jgi:hypothetical protein
VTLDGELRVDGLRVPLNDTFPVGTDF